MKHSIQRKLMRKFAGMPLDQIREQMAKELAEGDDELSRFWRRLGEKQSAPVAAPKTKPSSHLKTAKSKKSSIRRKPTAKSSR